MTVRESQRWKAVVDRDPSYDGQFYFGVVTTGVFCRPSCRSRRPLRANVRFFLSPELAEKSGLRACLRCRPTTDPSADLEWIAELCVSIREKSLAGERVTLSSLAKQAGKSLSQLKRVFRSVVGITPRQYAEACRLQSFRAELKAGRPITDAVYEAGFSSSSRLYELIDSHLGMTPSQYRDGGKVEISYAWMDSSLGCILVAATDRGLCSVEIGADRDRLLVQLCQEFPAAKIEASTKSPKNPQFRAWLDGVSSLLRAETTNAELPIDLRASVFRIKVWRYLQSIPKGEVRSYGEVASALGLPKGARAVAQACAANRLAVLIPCHRVIRGNGELGGYRWGIERKQQLLELETAFSGEEVLR